MWLIPSFMTCHNHFAFHHVRVQRSTKCRVQIETRCAPLYRCSARSIPRADPPLSLPPESSALMAADPFPSGLRRPDGAFMPRHGIRMLPRFLDQSKPPCLRPCMSASQSWFFLCCSSGTQTVAMPSRSRCRSSVAG